MAAAIWSFAADLKRGVRALPLDKTCRPIHKERVRLALEGSTQNDELDQILASTICVYLNVGKEELVTVSVEKSAGYMHWDTRRKDVCQKA